METQARRVLDGRGDEAQWEGRRTWTLVACAAGAAAGAGDAGLDASDAAPGAAGVDSLDVAVVVVGTDSVGCGVDWTGESAILKGAVGGRGERGQEGSGRRRAASSRRGQMKNRAQSRSLSCSGLTGLTWHLALTALRHKAHRRERKRVPHSRASPEASLFLTLAAHPPSATTPFR